jgi:hypothetical protein
MDRAQDATLTKRGTTLCFAAPLSQHLASPVVSYIGGRACQALQAVHGSNCSSSSCRCCSLIFRVSSLLVRPLSHFFFCSFYLSDLGTRNFYFEENTLEEDVAGRGFAT